MYPTASDVWIIDDDLDDQLLLVIAFKKTAPAIRLLTLEDGEDLLPQLDRAQQPPKLILLDLNMRKLNGLETLQKVRQIPAWRQLPIIVLTTSGNDLDREQSLAMGADQFICKPTNFQELLQVTQQLARQWQLT